MSKIPTHSLLHAHKSHPHPTNNLLHVHTHEKKCVDSYQIRVTDHHMKQFKSRAYLTYIYYDLFLMPQLEYAQISDITYIRNGCKRAIILNILTVKYNL
jgi:hypothetical protein